MPSSASANARDDAAALQHVGGAARVGQRFASSAHVGVTRRDQHQVVEAHHLQRARRRADVAGMARVHQDKAGRCRHGGKIEASSKPDMMRARSCVAAPSPSLVRHHVPVAAPDAQYRRQGGACGRGDHQPCFARPRPAEDQQQEPERLRHRGRPRGRKSDHRDAARGLSRPRHPRRGVGPRSWREGQRVRVDHRSARRHHQFHPRLSGLCGIDRAGAPRPGAAGGRLRPDAQRPVHRQQGAVAPTSTTAGCASASASA